MARSELGAGRAGRAGRWSGRLGRLAGVVVAAALALGPVGLPDPVGLPGGVRVAHAGDEWCEVDPAVLITTPGGRLVVVYVTNGALGLEHLVAAQLAAVRHTVQPVEGGRATLVKMDVVVPNDLFGSGFPTKTTVSSGPLKTLTVYASATGTSGSPMRLEFTLPVG